MDFLFEFKTHFFERKTPWIKLDRIRQSCLVLSVDIEDDDEVPCYDTEHELRLDKAIMFRSVKILTPKTQESFPYWEALLDMRYSDSKELRYIFFAFAPNKDGLYTLGLYFEEEDLYFEDDFIEYIKGDI